MYSFTDFFTGIFGRSGKSREDVVEVPPLVRRMLKSPPLVRRMLKSPPLRVRVKVMVMDPL
jgi:hypothetical protein